MTTWQRSLMFGTILLLLPVLATTTFGASISGRSSTVFEWYDDPQEDTALVGYQYLRFNVSDIGDQYNFRGYGRLADDFSDEVDVENRLYYAYLEKRNLVDDLDFRLGRQFISTTAGASLMDGINLKLRDLGPVDIKLFGGGDVTYYEGYSPDDVLVGGEVAGQLFKENLDLSLSYLQKWNEGDLAHEFIGFDADYRYKNLLNLYNETQYSWLTDEVTYFLVGGKYHQNERWQARLEYLYSLPVFSATSIYSVFAVNEYEEISAELTYKIDRGLRAFGRYTLEMYPEFDDANVFEVGVEKIRTDRFSGYLIGTYRSDSDGQDLHGVKAQGAYRLSEMFEGGIGAHLDVMERRIEDDDETTNTRIWVFGTAHLSKKVNLQAKVEYVESDLWDEYYRGRVRLNILF